MWKKDDLDPIEFLKFLATVVGAIFIFVAIQQYEADNLKVDTKKTSLEAVRLIQDALPILDATYDNRLSSDGRTIEVRANYIVKSAVPIYISEPVFELYSGEEKLPSTAFEVEDLQRLKGTFASGVENDVEFRILLKDDVVDISDLEVSYFYFAEMPLPYQALYRPLLEDYYAAIVENQPEKEHPELEDFLRSLWSVSYTYREKVYSYGAKERFGGLFNDNEE